jgi:hypothetical protein
MAVVVVVVVVVIVVVVFVSRELRVAAALIVFLVRAF